ncbi:phosphotransferase [Streptomyces silvensis]|uniref:Uncharacterized protein n=1 Tax=Streptomyces silvensis TaxID=1765722 RepID=A0A0W7X5E4_9ACTN|nr:phosphotransferase [Streptomyces silvensis]KUF18024.1 hypothetical protein AT728_20530 [Streptomyces silvensis]
MADPTGPAPTGLDLPGPDPTGPDLPGPDVLDAFRLTGTPALLPGGAGNSVRVGDAVLKPDAGDPESAEWLGDVMARVREDGFRVGRPLRARSGAWSHAGWSATRFVAGAEPDHAGAPRWLETVAAGRAFHRALAGVPRPAFLDRRSDWWAVGDRVAWQEREPAVVPALREPYEMLSALAGPPPSAPPQLVHGDLTGNVLYAPGLPPAVIDFSPYWRPPAFAEAVVVGDALLWHGAGTGLLRAAVSLSGPAFLPYVARALVFRLATDSARARDLGEHRAAEVVTGARSFARAARLLGAVRPSANPFPAPSG